MPLGESENKLIKFGPKYKLPNMEKEFNGMPMMVWFFLLCPILRHEHHSFYLLPTRRVICANASTAHASVVRLGGS